ncbi:hypothetical protein HRI_002443200 [Hibiscus trionum]|uniref:CCHC-type domain-containing protein n=1 Tax=Hibiscus trionum TaxID=183268 RepID=A0A9W7M4Q0_HIBTR|nr:hypothetical protein HRI_002443200 [Hibiscus trionum]
MDIDNDYFLATFRLNSDFLHVLTAGPCVVFGHYLTVEPWSTGFNTSQPHPYTIWSWIRLPGLPATLYKRSLITAIGECIGPVKRIDYQTEHDQRGRFARMVVQIDLRKPLISNLLINGNVQIVEYEALPVICFGCGLYGHLKDSCPDARTEGASVPQTEKQQSVTDEIVPPGSSETSQFGPWMMVERRQCRPAKKTPDTAAQEWNGTFKASRFNPIYEPETESPTGNAAAPNAGQGSSKDKSAPPGNPTKTKAKSKGKQPSVSRATPGLTVHKPLTLAEFPIIPRGSQRANTSKNPHTNPTFGLDKLKHFVVVLDENSDLNAISDTIDPGIGGVLRTVLQIRLDHLRLKCPR